MGAVIDFKKPRSVDAGIDLGRRQAGMAEQFLDGAQIAAAGQKMGGEGVAQCMWGRRIGQAEGASQLLHLSLDDGRLQWATAGAAEKGLLIGQMVGADIAVTGDRLGNDAQERHDTGLAALALDAQRPRAGFDLAGKQAERFGNAQAAALEER